MELVTNLSEQLSTNFDADYDITVNLGLQIWLNRIFIPNY